MGKYVAILTSKIGLEYIKRGGGVSVRRVYTSQSQYTQQNLQANK